MTLDFKTRLKQREVLLGTLVTLGATEVAEILSRAGFDWLWIEMEHAPAGLARVQEMIMATGGRVPCLVRTPWNDEVLDQADPGHRLRWRRDPANQERRFRGPDWWRSPKSRQCATVHCSSVLKNGECDGRYAQSEQAV
jgi:hypothetical protein